MRLLLIAPWFRTLAQIHGRSLSRLGHDVRVVTSDGHFQAGYGFVPESVLPARIRSAAWPSQLRALRRDLARWSPDLVLVDQSWDLRLTSLAGLAPWALLVHDAVPHDVAHQMPLWKRQSIRRLRRRATRVGCFSNSVAHELRSQLRASVRLLPLTSEMPEEMVSPPVEAAARRDFLVLGRLSPYKNLSVVFAAWSAHVRSPEYQGDQLVLIGDGALPEPLPPAARWERVRFDFADLSSRLPGFKASVVMYEGASQSGAQVTSMQVGVMPLASTSGGLPEYQPPERPCIAPADAAGLARALGELADGARAGAEGAAARAHFQEHFKDDVVGEALARSCAAWAGVGA